MIVCQFVSGGELVQLFDMHCDTLSVCYRSGASLCSNEQHIDLRRGRRYTPWCQVFAAFIPDTLRGRAAYRYCCRLLSFAREEEKRFPQQLSFVIDRAGLESAVRTGRCAGILAVEGGAALAGKCKHIAALAVRGVRVMTLTWNGDNELGHGCLSSNREGLTEFGRQAVREMHRVGIVPDVSHLNEAGFWDVATLSDAPFIASHSLSKAVCDHPRNLTDAQFKELRRRGGLVGVNLYPEHLGAPDFEAVYRHIAHYLSLDGEFTVAFGGDLDGTQLPDGWDGIAVFEDLAEYLLKKGLSEALLSRIFFKNAFDFFSATLQFDENRV